MQSDSGSFLPVCFPPFLALIPCDWTVEGLSSAEFRRFLQYCGTQIGNCVQEVKNTDQLNALIDRWNGLPACPDPYSCLAGGAIARVPSGTNFFSPFSSFDLRLNKVFKLTERASFSLIGEGFNLLNQTNVRGTATANYSGRNISIAPYQSSAPVQANFYTPVSVAGGFFGSGGARAFQFAARIDF